MCDIADDWSRNALPSRLVQSSFRSVITSGYAKKLVQRICRVDIFNLHIVTHSPTGRKRTLIRDHN